jgi:hypothetical protein
MKQHLRIAILMTLVTTVLFGLFYPLAVTGLGQLFFPAQAAFFGRVVFSPASFRRGKRLRSGRAKRRRLQSWPHKPPAYGSRER